MKEHFSPSDPHRHTLEFIENLKRPNLYSRPRKVVFWVGIVLLGIVGVILAISFLYTIVNLLTGNLT